MQRVVCSPMVESYICTLSHRFETNNPNFAIILKGDVTGDIGWYRERGDVYVISAFFLAT